MRLISVAAIFLVAQTLFASTNEPSLGYSTNATRMKCDGPGQISLIFNIDRDTNDVKVMNYFDGQTVWLAHSATVESTHYTMTVFRPDSAGSGAIMGDRAMARMNFTLPRNREVSRVQTGGYYMPVYTVYPSKFHLQISAQTMSGDELPMVNVDCVGY